MNINLQIAHANVLKKLHMKANPLVLYNIWDAGSAKAIQSSGAKVIATGSWSVAASHGYEDGEKLPFDLVVANLKRIIASVDLPVTIDLEGGYGQSETEIQQTIMKIIQAGAVGINFEDQIIGSDGMYSVEDQCVRIKAVDIIAKEMSIPLFINARTDIFLKAGIETHCDHHLKEAMHRASAYAAAGATGFFVPGLGNARYIEKLCANSPIPVNIMVMSNTPSLKHLVELGVARISYGPNPYVQVIKTLEKLGMDAFSLN